MRNYVDELTMAATILKSTCEAYFNYDSTNIDMIKKHDMDLQATLIKRIKQTFAGDTVVTQINPKENFAGHRTWTVECGGANHHIERNSKFFGVQISLVEAKDIVLSVIYLPFLDEMYTATLGGGAYMNGHQIHVSPRTVPNSCVAFASFPEFNEEESAIEIKMIKNIRDQIQEVYMLGSNALAFAYLASGKINGLVAFTNNISGINPGLLICQEAGALISNVDGKHYDYGNNNIVVADSTDLLTTIQQSTVEREAAGDRADSRIKIGYIGMQGDLGERAANQFATNQKFRFIDIIPAPDIKQIIRDMQIRKIDFAVVPISTSQGAIYRDVSEQLSRIRFERMDTIPMPLTLNLYKRTKDVPNGNLREVITDDNYYSFIDTKLRLLLPNVVRQSVVNASIAAKDLRDDKYNDLTAVVCSPESGEFNRLALVRENVLGDDVTTPTIEFRAIRYQG